MPTALQYLPEFIARIEAERDREKARADEASARLAKAIADFDAMHESIRTVCYMPGVDPDAAIDHWIAEIAALRRVHDERLTVGHTAEGVWAVYGGTEAVPIVYTGTTLRNALQCYDETRGVEIKVVH